MINSITSFFTTLRRKLFVQRIESEIFGRIAPHVNRERDHGYPFASKPELCTAAHHGNLDLLYSLEALERQAVHMDQAYGEALRYIMYRDLNRRLSMYARLIQHRVAPRLRVAQYA